MKTDDQKLKFLNREVAKLRKMLLLNGWTISISLHDDFCNRCSTPDGVACIKPTPEYLNANLRIHDVFWDYSLSDKRHTLIHEMCHILTAKMHLNFIELHNGTHVTKASACDDWEETTERLKAIIASIVGV